MVQILILGFQSSGTSIVRKILTTHPHIKGIFCDKFLLKKYDFKDKIIAYLDQKFNTSKCNWGEIISYYDINEGIEPIEYCKKWNEYFLPTAKIIHIVRHPLDVAAKIRNIKGVKQKEPLKLYSNSMRRIVPKLCGMKNVMTIKYEDLLLDPDLIIPRIFNFCGLSDDIDFRALMKVNKNIDILNPSGVFIHQFKKQPIPQVDLSSTYQVLNQYLSGEIY